MYNRYHIASCKTEIDDGSAIIYKYFLTQSQKDIYRDNGYDKVMAYGIEATCEKVLNGSITDVYTDAIECISPNKQKVLGLIEFLRRHKVSPIHLIDIVGSFVDDCAHDFDEEANVFMKTAATF